MKRFADRVAIVTGGGQGIGGATARLLSGQGARVLIAEINDESGPENVERIRQQGGEAEFIRCDVSIGDDVEAMVARASKLWGRLDILVNNAYGSNGADGSAVSLERPVWEYGIDVMMTSVYLGAKHAVPLMQHQGRGSIVNIASVHGQLMAPNALLYEAGKSAVIGMTRQMATDFGPTGVRVNAICPGHIVTEKNETWRQNPSLCNLYVQQYPVRRLGKPDDIAHAVSYLCSDEAGFITGHALVVDGGLTIQLQENLGVAQARYALDHPDTDV
jgi:NAD(P)-dependent dehydrogenase (short-subunit alcohol dehydrogenase family)